LPPTLTIDHDAFMHHTMHVLDAPRMDISRKVVSWKRQISVPLIFVADCRRVSGMS